MKQREVKMLNNNTNKSILTLSFIVYFSLAIINKDYYLKKRILISLIQISRWFFILTIKIFRSQKLMLSATMDTVLFFHP